FCRSRIEEIHKLAWLSVLRIGISQLSRRIEQLNFIAIIKPGTQVQTHHAVLHFIQAVEHGRRIFKCLAPFERSSSLPSHFSKYAPGTIEPENINGYTQFAQLARQLQHIFV